MILIKALLAALAAFFRTPTNVEPTKPVVSLPAMPENMPTQHSQKLYDTAAAYLGKRVAPLNAADHFGVLGCAITVNMLCAHAWGHPIGGDYSTAAMWECLKDPTKFKPILLALAIPGDIIISPTGSAPGAPLKNGHVGVVAKHGILSNSSETGRLEENYSIKSWVAYFSTYGGLPTLIYRAL